MHDYLWMFKDSKTVKKLHTIRENHSICFYEGTIGKPISKIKGEILASIQLYEYILYDLLINENVINSINLDERRAFHLVYQAIKDNALTKKSEQKKLARELEIANFKISTMIDHDKYCKLYSQAKTPDYLDIFKDQTTTQQINYIRIQNGIKIHEGTAKVPWLMDSLPYRDDMKTSIQLYEYILYDSLFNDNFHRSLSKEEEFSTMRVLNTLANNSFGLPKNIHDELANDIAVTNTCIGRNINNKKYFELYSTSTICREEEAMNFTYSDLHLYREANKVYQKRKGPDTEKAS